MKKIVNKAELLRQVAAARAEGKAIVHCHGCFDIVHPGHVRYLEFARRQGDVLVVSLTGDAAVSKAPQRPYIPEELRAENLAALEAVDLVYIDPHPTACQLLADLKPDIYVKGREYEQSVDPGFVTEREIVSANGGRVLFSSGDVVFSSSRLIEALSREPTLDIERLATICRRHQIHREVIGSLLSRFAGLRVLVVGDVVLDRYVLCDATELASEAPMMSLTQLEERVHIGGAGVVARHLAGLGASTYLLSAAAGDEKSVMVADTFAADFVQARLIPCRHRLPDKTRYLVDTTKVLQVEDGESHPLDSLAENDAADWVNSIAGKVDAVIFCDFGYGTITGGLLDRLRNILGGSVRITAADTSGPRGQLLDFRHVDLLCPTERTLRSSLHDFEQGLSTVAWNAMDHTQARQMLVSLGKKGLVVFDRQSRDASDPEWRGRLRSEYVPAMTDRLIDPLGCDGALLATTTLAMAAGGSLMQSAYLGMAAMAIEGECLGNEPINASMLRRWLSGRLELTQSRRRPPGQVIRFEPTPGDRPIDTGKRPVQRGPINVPTTGSKK